MDTHEEALPVLAIAGFWRRLLAALVDGLILGLVGFGLAALFYDSLVALGAWGRGLGFAIAVAYMGVTNSAIGEGQSPGKRVLKIRVITRDGSALGVKASLGRAVVLCLPYFLNGLPVEPSPGALWLAVPLSVAVFGLGLSILYLLVFNRRTRQSLHDLAVGSYVVAWPAQAGAPPPAGLWRGHRVVVAGLLALAVAAPLAMMWWLPRYEPWATLLPVQQALAQQPGVSHVSVVEGVNAQWSGEGKKSSSYVFVTAVARDPDPDKEALANQLAGTLLARYPQAAGKDILGVSMVQGFDIGIASGWRTHNYAFSPAKWRERLAVAPSS